VSKASIVQFSPECADITRIECVNSRMIEKWWVAEIYPPRPTGTPVLSFFLFGGSLRIKTPLLGGDFLEMIEIGDYHW
jgi:hypothetical protein